jgi:hypothetical protein
MIFISYNHASKPLVAEVVKRLRQENLQLWYDEDEIKVGDEQSKKMQKGILDSHTVLFFISKLYLKSDNCKLEFNYAFNRKKKRIFLVLEQLDPTDVNGIEMHLYGDSVRLDVFKLQKGATIDNNLIEEIYKKIAPALNLKYNAVEQIDNKRGIKRVKRDYFFIGREDVFNKMDKILQTEKLIILHGLPGVGKTSCAIEYVLGRFHNELIKQYFVFYADEMYKIRDDISRYCKELNLCKDTDDFETKMIKFKELIAKSRDIILIFDNVENFDDLINLIDYEELNKPTIITSRHVKDEYYAKSIEIYPLSVIDTKKYFKKLLPNLSDVELNTIIDHIKHGDNCLTYKAVLTAGYLKNNPSLTVEKLITQNFKDSYFSGIISRIDSESNDAIRILKFLSYLHPDEISKKILEKVITDDTRLNIALQILCNYNLCKIVNPNSGQFGISVHRLLQNDIKINFIKT